MRICHNHRRSGSALLTVLWLTAALSAIGLAVANNVRGETERAGTNVEDVKAYFVATGAIQRAILHMNWGRQFYTPGMPAMDLDFPVASVHVEIVPETSKLGLNSSRVDDFVHLLTILGMRGDQAGETAAAIVDWRTPDPLHASPFDAFYLAQAPSFLPPHASFTKNEELLLVKGITPDLFYGTSLGRTHAGLRDCVSVYGGGGGVDINTAQPETMQAVGLSAGDATELVRMRTEQGMITPLQYSGIRQSLGPSGNRLGIGGSTMFTLRATARMKQADGKLSDLRRTVGALIKFWNPGNTQNRPPGFQIVQWFDRA